MQTPLSRGSAAARGGLLALALVGVLGGCAAPAPPPPAEDAAARAQALIDSGNTAYTAGEYNLAAKRYAAAAVVRPDDSAAYFGMGMALSKLGRDEEARVAYGRARELATHERNATRGPVP